MPGTKSNVLMTLTTGAVSHERGVFIATLPPTRIEKLPAKHLKAIGFPDFRQAGRNCRGLEIPQTESLTF